MDKTRIAAGLSLLVNAKDFTKRCRQIVGIIEDWNDTPMLFGGALEPLNSLIDVGLANREALERLFALASSKRKELPEAKRVDYQRELMREKRERLYRAVELEELMRGTPLKGAARAKYMKETQARWMAERVKFVAAKGELSWKERNEAANAYWHQVDTQLEHDLAEARRVLDRPPMKRQRRVVEVPKPKPNTTMAKAFESAKRH